MVDNSNLLSTPTGYATPEQLKAQYDYAKVLLGQSTQPIQHWTQGVSSMVNALVGGAMNYDAGQKERARRLFNASQDPTVTSMQPPGETPKPFSSNPSPAGVTSSGADRASKAVASLESDGSGGYLAEGPVTKTGDRAYGKYQVMGSNIPVWTKETLGKEMTPAEFLKNPDAQEAVFKNKFGEYTSKYGPEGASRAWFAGEGNMNNRGAKDQLGTTVGSYGDRFARAYAGPDNVSANPAVAAVSNALRGKSVASDPGIQVAGGPDVIAAAAKPVPGGPIGPKGLMNADPPLTGQIFIDPALVPKRPQYNAAQFRNLLASEDTPDAMKMQIRAEAAAQGQPISVPYMGGAIVVDPRDPRKQQYITSGEWKTNKIGDMEFPTFVYFDPVTKQVMQAPTATPKPVGTVGPRSDATPVAPTGGPVGGPATAPVAPGGSVNPVASASPAAPPSPTTGIVPPVATSAPVQVASLDPKSGVAAVTPDVVPSPIPESTPLARVAQAGPPPGVPQQVWDAYKQKQAHDKGVAIDQLAKEEKLKADVGVDRLGREEMVKQGVKKYENLSSQAAAARKQMPNLDYGLALVNDPNIYQGLFSNEVTAWKKLMAAFPGVFGADAATGAAPNEVFNKVISGSILDNMKTALAGLGQVRVAEIDLLKQANASNQNTPAANRALLELSRRAVQSVDHLDELAQSYVSGDDVINPITGQVMLKANVGKDGEVGPRHGLDAGYDKLARKFILEHPTLSKEDIQNYQTIFRTGIDPRRPDAALQKTGEAPAVGTVKTFSDGKGGQVEGQWDGKAWGPKK